MHAIAYLLGGVGVFGYAVSFLRDRAFAHYFGPSELLDIYVASFRIPDVLFIAATAFISVYALLPIFEEKMQQGKECLREFVNTTFYFLIFFLLFGGTALFFAIPFLGDLLFSSFSGESREIFILFSRVYLIQASLFAVSSFFTAILQLKRKFLLYSLLPILYNLGIIFGVIILYPMFGAVGLAFGVLLGVAMHTLIQLPVMLQNDVLPHLAPTRHTVSECWRAIKMSIPRASALIIYTVTHVFIFGVVSRISEGSLSIFYFAENIKAVPISIIGTAYSVATFPILVAHFTKNNMEAFRSVIEGALRRLFFFILPAIAVIFVLREPLISLLFETGFFTAQTAAVTATILGVFMLGSFTMSILIICARALYACGRALTAFIIFAALSATEILLIYTVIPFVQHNQTVQAVIQNFTGLETTAYSVLFTATLIIVVPEVFAAAAILTVLIRGIRQRVAPLLRAFAQNAAAITALMVTIFTMRTLFFSGMIFNSLAGMIAIGGMALAGAVVWYVVLRILKNEESTVFRESIRRIFGRVWKT